MKTSVSLITYNHAPFIAQAVESVLSQQTRFDWELLIGEDDSKDGTRGIVKGYQAGHPSRIRLLLNDRKNVAYVNGVPTGQWNFANNILNCRGQYIALLDGDDYWTSASKLQKQVDFLDANPGCAICFHNVQILDESNPGQMRLHHPEPMRGRYELEDLLRGNFMHTCSVVFRRGLFEEFPPWFFKCPMGDWPLHVLNGRHGWIGYLDEVMAVYRKHTGGVWSAQAPARILSDSIQAADQIRDCLPADKGKALDDSVAAWYRQIIELNCKAGDAATATRFARLYLKRFFLRRKTRPVRIFLRILRARFQRRTATSLAAAVAAANK